MKAGLKNCADSGYSVYESQLETTVQLTALYTHIVCVYADQTLMPIVLSKQGKVAI